MTHSTSSAFAISVRRPARRRILKAVNLVVQVAVVASITLSGGFGLGARPAQATPGSGAIWTTTGSCGTPQNTNHYHTGDHVFINGSGFDANDYDWNIGKPGNSGSDVASGTFTVGESGDFCFDAYTIQPSDSGEYQAKFGGVKGDNYQVDPAVGSLTLTKVVDTGAASPDSFAFTINPDPNGVSPVSTTGGAYTFTNLPVGNYTISEASMSGYYEVSNDCDVSVAASQTATCTIHNARLTHNVVITKNVVGGTAQPSDWTFTLSNDEATYSGIHSGDTTAVFTGTYAISEQGPSGYTMSGVTGDCYDDGGFFLYTDTEGPAHCTVTNTYNPTPANLTISKTDHRVNANPGDVLTYEVTVTNSGDAAASFVQVTDTVPNFVTNVANISDSGTLSTNVITWNNLIVPGHGTKTVSFDGTVSPSIPVGTTVLHNVANLGCSFFLPEVITLDFPFDFFPFDQLPCLYSGTATDDTSVTVVAPTLSITKTNDSGASVNPGATVTYTVVVTNAASATQAAANVVLTDTLPAGFTYTVGGGSTKSFALGSINPGASSTTTYTASVSSSQAAGTYTNTASAAASNAATVSATSNVVVVVPQVLGIESPDLSITKSVNNATANPGDTLTYSVTVKNVGTSNALNTVLSDTLPAGFTFAEGGSTKTWSLGTLAAGAETTITYDVVIGSDVSAGTYTNAASVSADGVSPRNAEVSVEVKVGQVLGLATTGPSAFDYFLFTLGGLLVALGALSLARLNRAGSPKA